MPDATTVKIYCQRCRTLLYRYRKRGTGHLVKCFLDRIVKDHTRGDRLCPGCGVDFARDAVIRGKPAHKIIQGRVYVKR